MYIVNLFGRDGIGFTNIEIDKSGAILTKESSAVKIIDLHTITSYRLKDLKIYITDLMFEDMAMDMFYDRNMVYRNSSFKDCMYKNLLELIRRNNDGYDFYFTGLNKFKLIREYRTGAYIIEDELKYIIVGRLGKMIEEKAV
jgi:hypothetical protein|nr:MAG TPA: hypothetical protein [Caudoviricetes sp.]